MLGRPARPRELDPARWFEAVKVGLAVVAGLGAAVGLTVSYRRQRVEEGRQRLEEERHQAERIKEFGDRYTKAGELLGHEKAAVRLAGVVAFARLADDWVEQQQTCIDVLCSYLRMPYNPATADSGEREVRLTVIRAIRDHLVRDAPVSWQGRDFDFTGATFDGGRFVGATFSGGMVSFDGATFSGGAVRFVLATFSDGWVSFFDATFSGGGVSFGGAMFSGAEVGFDGAKFYGGKVLLDRVSSWDVPAQGLRK